jgi:hypothetical protein
MTLSKNYHLFRARTWLTLIAIVLITQTTTHAQLIPELGSQRAGTAAAQFLKIGVGGRAVGMGETFIAVANDASALYWNPAGMAQFEGNQLILSHVDWPVDIKHEFVGYVHHVSPTNAIGVSFTSLHMDDMEETTEFAPAGTGNFFTFRDIAIGLSFARKMTDKFSFGTTVKYIEETLAEVEMRSVMVDLGMYYWTGFRSTRFAVAITNFGQQLKPGGQFTRRDGTTVNKFQSFVPPTLFKLGFATELMDNEQNKLTVAVELNHPNDNAENVHFGGEYWWHKRVALRSGYKLNVDEESFTFGAGLSLPLSIAHANLDYAYTDFGRLGNANRFSFVLSF